MFSATERTSARYRCTLLDHAGALVPASSLDTLTLTLIDVTTAQVLNSRDAQDVLNTNGVTVYETLQTDAGSGATYSLEWILSPADNAIVSTAKKQEAHLAVFHATWDNGAKELVWKVGISVENVPTIPA